MDNNAYMQLNKEKVLLLLVLLLFIPYVSATKYEVNGTVYYPLYNGTYSPNHIEKIDYNFTTGDFYMSFDSGKIRLLAWTGGWPNDYILNPETDQPVSMWSGWKAESYRTSGQGSWIEMTPLTHQFVVIDEKTLMRSMTTTSGGKLNITYKLQDGKLKFIVNRTAGTEGREQRVRYEVDFVNGQGVFLNASKRFNPGFNYTINTLWDYNDIPSPAIFNASQWLGGYNISQEITQGGSRYNFIVNLNGSKVMSNGISDEFDPSWSTNGSTTPVWVNTFFNSTVNDPNIGHIENDLLYSNYLYRYKGGLKDWNRTSPDDCTLVGGAVSNSTGLYLDGTGDGCNLGNNEKLNLSGVNSFIISFIANTINSDDVIGFSSVETDGVWKGYDQSFYGTTQIRQFGGSSGAFINNNVTTGVLSYLATTTNSTTSFVLNGSLENVGTSSLIKQISTSRGLGSNYYGGSSLNGVIFEAVIYNRSFSNITDVSYLYYSNSGNVTSWYDSGSGNETYQIDVNVTTPANTNYTMSVYNNDTLALIESWTNLTGNQSKTITGTKAQDTKINITLFGNTTATPELMGIMFYSQTASAGASTYIPPSPTLCASQNGTTWINVSCSSGSGNITDGMNFTKVSPASWQNGTQFYQNFTGLSEGTVYDFRIYAWNNSGGGTLNQTYVSVSNTTQVTLDVTSPASVSNYNMTTWNFGILNQWTNPISDFDHIEVRNMTTGSLLTNLTNTSWNRTLSAHYTQNISYQTVDVAGNVNQTKVWFNITIPNNPIQLLDVPSSPISVVLS